MFKLNLSANASSSLSAELASHADVEVVSETADVTLIDCSASNAGSLKEALAAGTPVLLYKPDQAALASLEELTGHAAPAGTDILGIRQVSTPQGAAGYEILDGSDLPVTSGTAASDEPAPAAAPPASLADRVAALAARLRVTAAPHALLAGTNNYTPPVGAKYWHVTNAWGPDTRTIGHGDDVNVRNKLNGSVQAQTPSFMVTADLHIYYTDDPQPSYIVIAKYQATAAAGYRLANTGDARGYFLSKIYMDFQLEVSGGNLTPLDHIPRNFDGAEGAAFGLTAPQMQLKVKSDRGISVVNFQPEDSVIFSTKGWGIKDESAGNRVKICFHQKEGWNAWAKVRDAFGSWWPEAFGGNYNGHVNGMADASFSTITTQAVGAWRISGSFDGNHDIYMTLRPGDMSFHQEMAFLHNVHSCYAGGDNSKRHHHISWTDFWAGNPWYLHLSDLPKPL